MSCPLDLLLRCVGLPGRFAESIEQVWYEQAQAECATGDDEEIDAGVAGLELRRWNESDEQRRERGRETDAAQRDQNRSPISARLIREFAAQGDRGQEHQQVH